MFSDLPKIGEEITDKKLKTEAATNRHQRKFFTIKNNVSKNANIKNKKNKSGNSLDMKLNKQKIKI